MALFSPSRIHRLSLLQLAAGSCLALGLAACKQTEPAPTTTAPTDGAQAAAKSAPAPSPTPSVSESAGPAGTVRVVSANAEALQRPTTAAFRGQTLWVSIGQLSALFTEGG